MINSPSITNNTSAVSSDIASLLMPVAEGKQVLLPTVSVAEMLSYKKPQIRDSQIDILPYWFLGNVRWRGVMVPMFSYEAINGGAVAGIKGISQMAILNNTGTNNQLPFICFPTQGIPRLSRISTDSMTPDNDSHLLPYDEINVLINDEAVTIPNVAKIEQAITSLLGL